MTRTETKAMVRYVWKGGSGDDNESTAQAVGERLARIEKKNGTLKPSLVVDDARSIRSPLHTYFEWDDGKAAEAYRLDQARHLIARVCAKSVGNREIENPVRAFVNLRAEPDSDRQYENIFSVMSDEMKRKRLLTQARQELAEWRARYDELNEFADLFPVIDRLVA